MIWTLEYNAYEPAQEGLREALCTLGNGYFATRGASPDISSDEVHYPGTYVAGGFNRLRSEVDGRSVENEDLVNMPNWLVLRFRVKEGPWFRTDDVELLDYHQRLDIRQGILHRRLSFRDDHGRETQVEERRLVHMGFCHIAAQELKVTPLNWSGRIEFESALDGGIRNEGVKRYRDLANNHLCLVEGYALEEEGMYLKVETIQSELRIALSARTRFFQDQQSVQPERRTELHQGRIAQQFALQAEQNQPLRVEKVVSLYTSRDNAISEAGLESRKRIFEVGDFEALLETHGEAWAQLWYRFDSEFLVGDPDGDEARMALHLHIFHLLQTVSMNTMDLDISVPSRGWHGEAYRGHIFWDEMFIFPLLNYRVPEITRELLQYRHRRLREARKHARDAGFEGALFPWQSGSNGREESQVLHLNPRSGRWLPDNSRLQYHINSAIAWNIWQHYQVTHDREFLAYYGAEMFLEIARFWASIAAFDPSHERYVIRRVMGPDEYHDAYPGASEEDQGIDNNAYTNVMAAWVLEHALHILKALPEDRASELCRQRAIDESELEKWRRISHRMFIPFHGDGIISQFEGYDDLEELDWHTYRREHGSVMRLDRILEAEDDTPNRYKASKQADVLMLFYLFSKTELQELFDRLGYSFGPETISKNVAYYLDRASHGSTLSQMVHSWVLARLDRAGSWSLFCEALRVDIADVQGGTTPEGIHLGAMAGTVDLMQRGYTGLSVHDEVLWFEPRLPDQIERLDLLLRYRGHTLQLGATHEKLILRTVRLGKAPVKVGYRDQVVELGQDQVQEFNLQSEPPVHEEGPSWPERSSPADAPAEQSAQDWGS